jgi:hypothetical protein
MQRFLENKLAFAAILLLFALAMVCNATIGNSQSNSKDWNLRAAVQKGPNIPPDPWDWNKVQKGPNIPPDPWDWRASNGVHKGPNIPPDPWDWNKAHKGPNIPPDPWDWVRAV